MWRSLIPSQKSLALSNFIMLCIMIALVSGWDTGKTQESGVKRDYSTEYKFTNPILDYENVQMETSSLFYSSINQRVSKLKEKYGIGFASVYYRDLNNGQWIGINEKEEFSSASLIKLPVLIALLKQEEVQPGILHKVVTVSPLDAQGIIEQDIKPKNTLVIGESYTLLEIAERMIQESDNVAMNILLKNIDEKYRTGVFEAVGVDARQADREILVRVKDYAGFFRTLFNASYLSRHNSERALDILSKTSFDKGIVAGVPKGIIVSHKFGERSGYKDDILVSKQLHDCGIIYYPNKPYILCIMTRGNNYENQTIFIKEISRLFFEELEKSL